MEFCVFFSHESLRINEIRNISKQFPINQYCSTFYRGHYVGIHTSNFRDFMLKPELSRAIVDCGFEHPSEG